MEITFPPEQQAWLEAKVAAGEFDSVEAARRWYDSPDYREARKVREGAAKVRLFIAEGAAPAL